MMSMSEKEWEMLTVRGLQLDLKVFLRTAAVTGLHALVKTKLAITNPCNFCSVHTQPTYIHNAHKHAHANGASMLMKLSESRVL